MSLPAPGVASPSENLARNLAALQRVGVQVESALAWSLADGEAELEGNDVAGVFLRGRSGSVRMHTRRDPTAEAARLLPSELRDSGLVVLVGAGAGFVLDALEHRGHTGRVLVLEPSGASARAALSRRDWTPRIEAGRLRWLLGPDYAGWMDVWSWVAANEAPEVVVHPVLARERPDAITSAVDLVKRLAFNARANEEARGRFQAKYLLNTLANLRDLVASRDVAGLFGRFAGVPAFLLAAGPSLNRNLTELAPRRQHGLVIAVDTALRPALAVGLEPDFVVAVDPGEANLRHLTVDAAPPRTHLVAEPSVAPGSFAAFGDRVFTFRVAQHHPWPWLEGHGIVRGKLLAWGSVLTTTLDFAVRLGCDPVVFFGADFAYTNGQPYCRGTAYEEDWSRAVAAGDTLADIWRRLMPPVVVEGRGIDGHPVGTSPHLQAFRDWVVGYCAKHPDVRFVNATGAGILETGASMAWTDKLDPSVHNCVSAGVPPRPRPREADAVTGRLVHAARKALRRPANDRPACADQWLATIDAETDDRASVSTVLDVLAMSRRHPIINRLPNVPIAHHDREFETLLGWIDELADVRVLVEIGSRFGGSFYALASHVGAPLTAISIDLPGGPWGIPGTDESLMKVASDLRGQDIDAHVLLGDSHDSDTVNRLTHVLAGRPIDVLFVDGDHRLAGVAADLSLYPPLVRPGGLVAVHDVGWPYGRDAVDRFDAQAMHTLVDVQAAFTALARGRRWAIETHQWGMGAVWM